MSDAAIVLQTILRSAVRGCLDPPGAHHCARGSATGLVRRAGAFPGADAGTGHARGGKHINHQYGQRRAKSSAAGSVFQILLPIARPAPAETYTKPGFRGDH